MTKKTFDVYWLPNCSTCKKAVAFLEEKGAEVRSFRDLKADPLSRSEVENLVSTIGGADALFSKRAVKYRTMRLSERTLSDTDMIKLMAGEYTFVKRPVLVSGKRAIAGFSVKRYEAFLDE